MSLLWLLRLFVGGVIDDGVGVGVGVGAVVTVAVADREIALLAVSDSVDVEITPAMELSGVAESATVSVAIGVL